MHTVSSKVFFNKVLQCALFIIQNLIFGLFQAEKNSEQKSRNNFVGIFVQTMKPKGHFEINWPLVYTYNHQKMHHFYAGIHVFCIHNVTMILTHSLNHANWRDKRMITEYRTVPWESFYNIFWAEFEKKKWSRLGLVEAEVGRWVIKWEFGSEILATLLVLQSQIDSEKSLQ